jgi:hypothetical protein
MKSKLFIFMAVAAVSLYLVSAVPAQWSRNAGNSDVYLTNLSDDVGIGINNPARQLHVRGENAIFRLDRWVNSPGFIISRLQHGIAAPLKTFHVGVKAWGVDAGRFFIEDLHTAEGGDGDVRLAIDEDGDVGIGTTTPGYKLDVVGDCIRLRDTTSGAANTIMLGTSGTECTLDTANANLSITTYDPYDIIMQTAGGSGNIGIGTLTPEDKLQVEATGTVGSFRSTSSQGTGLQGECNNGLNAWGVYGLSSTGYAGKFQGDVDITGTLTKTAGAFKIDHPLDPENMYLYHSFVESPEMKNIYDGVVELNGSGGATVKLPDWFETLNRDFRYQLTAIGQPAPNLYIAREISDNSFEIAGGSPLMKVSWLVTGIRQDPAAEEYRIPVEEYKPEAERGYYLHPEVYGQPENKSATNAMMRRKKMEADKE